MLKSRYILTLLLFIFYNGTVSSQSSEGLRDIVSLQQEKISRIEGNLKRLVGLIEEQANINKANDNLKIIKKQIDNINDKLRLFEISATETLEFKSFRAIYAIAIKAYLPLVLNLIFLAIK